MLDRRRFLVASGALGATALVVGSGSSAAFARALQLSPIQALSPVLAALARNTMGGLVAFVVPGPDPFSQQQGVTSPLPGAIAANGQDFMIKSLDNFLPLPQEAIRPLIAALATGTSDQPQLPPLLGPILGPLLDLSAPIDAALAPILQGQGAAPLSLPIAMLLNAVATSVDPSAVTGHYLDSPFANLSARHKGEVFRRMEEDTASVAALLDQNLPEPLHRSLSGVVAFVAGALLEFSAFGAYSEWDVFDTGTRTLTGVPVGWRGSQHLTLTGFVPVEGYADFKGYYEGRKEATS